MSKKRGGTTGINRYKLRYHLSFLRSFRAWQLQRAAEMEHRACTPVLEENFKWETAHFRYDDAEREEMLLTAERLRSIFDDPGWVYRELENTNWTGFPADEDGVEDEGGGYSENRRSQEDETDTGRLVIHRRDSKPTACRPITCERCNADCWFSRALFRRHLRDRTPPD